MATLCDLAQQLPQLIGNLLDREEKLERGRFREETMTDVFTGSLAAFAGPNLVIEYPDEPKTGGDIDINYWHVSSGDCLKLRIQAKRLNSLTYGNGKKKRKAMTRSYEHLDHKVSSTGEYQFETLTANAQGRIPLYMFYNHASVVRDTYFVSKRPLVRGVNLAFAWDVRRLMKKKLGGAEGSHFNKRLMKLQPYFFDLKSILCVGGDLNDLVPNPRSVWRELQRAWLEIPEFPEELSDLEKLVERMLRPSDLEEALSFHSGLVSGPSDGASVRTTERVQRPTITLISGRTEENQGPDITNEVAID